MQQKKTTQSRQRQVLCVDLDGTLIHSDLLVESILALVRSNPFYLFLLPVWLFRGKACLKNEIAKRVSLDVSILPYNEQLLDYLRAQKQDGRKIVLASASHEKFVRAVAEHLGLFDEVLATNSSINLSGKAKLTKMNTKFGEGAFDYAGNSRVDLAIYEGGAGIVLVNPDRGVRERARELGPVIAEFTDRHTSCQPCWEALRPHQWLKNGLIFVPMLLAHEFGAGAIAQAVLAFVAFGLCASSVYLLNDLLDLPDDRVHPSKKNRPLAAGRLSVLHALVMAPVLLIAAFAVAALLPLQFIAVLATYYVITLTYSLFFKRTMLFDVIILAGLYTLRIVAGTTALTLERSSWLLAFSVFLFFSLALVKRYVELSDMADMVAARKSLTSRARAYRPEDRETLSQLGIASGLLAVLVLALYIDTDVVRTLYSRPELLWLVCPLMLYLVSRIWMLARRGDLVDDPVLFAIQDWRSQVVMVLGVGVILLAAF